MNEADAFKSQLLKSRQPNHLTTRLLAFMQGPLFLTCISLCLLALTIPAQATLLRGGINHTEKTEPPVNHKQTPAIPKNSFPSSFAGQWHCLTLVIDSAVSAVPSGQQVESEVNFVKEKDGRVLAHFAQEGWMDAQTEVRPLGTKEISLKRTSYYFEHGLKGSWSTRSHDRYLQLDADRIEAISLVEQFIDGHFLGLYQTKSVLYRIKNDLAFNNN